MFSKIQSPGYWAIGRAILLLPLLIAFSCPELNAQQKKKVDILWADLLEPSPAVPNVQRLIGNVRLKHNEVLINCDSAYAYSVSNKVDGFGNVHVNQGDTIHLYSDRVYYDGNLNFARAFGNVRLVKQTTTIYSDTVDYDLIKNIGYYDDKGRIVDSTNVLTSRIGRYFVDKDLIYFYFDVEGHNDKYTMKSDSISYNTTSEIIYINSPTTIKDTTNTLYAEGGWYDTKTGNSELTKNPVLLNEKQQLTGKYINYDGVNKKGFAKGYVEINDFENKTIVKGMFADYDEKLEVAMVTDSAELILYNEKDSLFLHADTLRAIPDTIKDKKKVLAYHKVRFYRQDVQGVCDSMVYYSKDSTVQFFSHPVIWSDVHQMSADLIEMKSNAPAPDEVHMMNNAFIISRQDSVMFDQIKGKSMTGYIVNNEISSIDVNGNGQTLYYARDESQIIGLNNAESSKITIKFKEGKINRISFFTSPTGKLTPLDQVTNEQRKLGGFDWKEALRPLNRTDIFRAR